MPLLFFFLRLFHATRARYRSHVSACALCASQPGRYDTPLSVLAVDRPGDSVVGGSAFAGPDRGLTTKKSNHIPGPGAHRPEAYGGILWRPISAPYVQTQAKLRAPFVKTRNEVRARGTPPSIPLGTGTSFAFEEDDAGELKPVEKDEDVPLAARIGPFAYTPHADKSSAMRNARRVDFGRGTGRHVRPVGFGSSAPSALQPNAPGWHDGTSANPLPSQPAPSSSFSDPDGATPGAYPAMIRQSQSAHNRWAATGTGNQRSCGGARPSSSPNPFGGGVVGAMETQRSAGVAVASPDQPHLNRHSRGRTRARGVLVATTGVPGSKGGLLGRSMQAKRDSAPNIGPGSHDVSGTITHAIGATRRIPPGGFPRAKPFHSPHLSALGKFPQTSASQGDLGVSSRPESPARHGEGGAEEMGLEVGGAARTPAPPTPTAHVISYAAAPRGSPASDVQDES